jgi:hypothetical protein
MGRRFVRYAIVGIGTVLLTLATAVGPAAAAGPNPPAPTSPSSLPHMSGPRRIPVPKSYHPGGIHQNVAETCANQVPGAICTIDFVVTFGDWNAQFCYTQGGVFGGGGNPPAIPAFWAVNGNNLVIIQIR